MHMEAAGEGPTNQVLQTHKSVACAKLTSPLLHIFCFAVILCWMLSDVTLQLEFYWKDK